MLADRVNKAGRGCTGTSSDAGMTVNGMMRQAKIKTAQLLIDRAAVAGRGFICVLTKECLRNEQQCCYQTTTK
jgi:hypothetical protein